MLAHVGCVGVPIDGRGSLSDHKRKRFEGKARRTIKRKSLQELMQTRLKTVDWVVPIGHGQ